MAQEIYYTSAMQGLRRGNRGFCTVAATEGISRSLWDRLESLSGYTHYNDPGMPGRSPVCHAHWVLHLEGRDYHVLSRVCDAGLDYTERTNSLAHHIVLDSGEMASAGPAWMLRQPGAMIERWDGQVGPIVRRMPLPHGDAGPGSCYTWQQFTGDAGWAGAIAQSIATTPWKPIGLIFAPDHPVLSLVAEVIALLPPASRWQATFNTYFTSLPSGMTCQWRCCLAGTPAAASLRSATAGSVLIDLTQKHNLKPPPENAWTQAARLGQPMPVSVKPAARTAAVDAPHSPPPGPVPLTGPAAPSRSIAPPPGRSVVPIQSVFNGDDDDSALDDAPPAPAVIEPGADDGRVVIHRGGRPAPRTDTLSQRETSAPQPEISWAAQRRKDRQRRMMILYAIGVAAIAIGCWLATWAYRSSSEFIAPVVPVKPPASAPAVTRVEPVITPPTQPAPRPTPIVEPIRPTPPINVPTPVITPPRPTVTVTPPPQPPAPIALEQSMPHPPAGKGLRDVVSTVSLPANKIEHPTFANKLSITLPDRLRQWRFEPEELDGACDIRPDGNDSHPGFILTWRETASPAGPAPVVTVALDKTSWQLEFTWSTSLMLRRPRVTALAYWILQNSEFSIGDGTDLHTQRITFGSVQLKSGRLSSTDLSACLPDNLPLTPKLAGVRAMPAGWQEGIATPPADSVKNITQSLRLEKPLAQASVTPGFTLRLCWSDHSLSSDLTKATDAAKADLTAQETDLKQVEDEIQQLNNTYQPLIQAADDAIKDWNARSQRGIKDPQPGDFTHAEIQAELKRARTRLRSITTSRDKAMEQPLIRLRQSQNRCAVLRDALNACREIKELELVVELPQGLRVGVLRLVRDTE